MTKNKPSRTMRIDLIPDVPLKTNAPGRKRPPAGKRTVRAKERTAHHELFDRSYDAILVTDRAGTIADLNRRAVEFLGYTRDRMLGMTMFDVISGTDKSLMKVVAANMSQKRHTLIRAYCVRQDATFFPAEIAVSGIDAPAERIAFSIRDITLRTRAETMLRTTFNAMQNLPTGIAMANPDAKLEFVNPMLLKMWGYQKVDDLLGKPVQSLLIDRGTAETMIRAVKSGKASWEGELQAGKADGGAFDVQISASCNRNSDGVIIGLLFAFVDVSGRRRAQTAEREAERNRVMKESLLAACYHVGKLAASIRASLAPIKPKTGAKDDRTQEAVSNALAAVDTLDQLLERLKGVNVYKTCASDRQSDHRHVSLSAP